MLQSSGNENKHKLRIQVCSCLNVMHVKIMVVVSCIFHFVSKRRHSLGSREATALIVGIGFVDST